VIQPVSNKIFVPVSFANKLLFYMTLH